MNIHITHWLKNRKTCVLIMQLMLLYELIFNQKTKLCDPSFNQQVMYNL